MEISVVFHRFYRKFFEDTYENVIYQFDLSRETLPFRASIRDFDLDPPLTYKGLKDSYHTGTVLKDKNIHISYCYSSPALRCVQTAAKILEGLQLQNKLKIRLEPGLFECTGWYTASETSNVLTMPKFLTKKEFLENKYVIDKHYQEQMSVTDVSQLENELEFYQRSHAVTASILKMHETEYVTQIQQGQITAQQPMHILFIAHAPNLETCTRKLCGGKFRPDTLPHVIRNVDFLTMTVIEKTDNNCDKWIFRRSSFYGDEF
jgi:ubiquitin-associated SH3 domain-containing protein